MNLLRHPHLLVWLAIPLLWIVPLLCSSKLFEVQIHDTYLVFPLTTLSTVATFALGGTGLLYALISSSGRYLNRYLSVGHVTTLLIAIIVLGYITYFSPSADYLLTEETTNRAPSFYWLTTLFVAELLLVLLSTTFFLANVSVGIVNRIRATD